MHKQNNKNPCFKLGDYPKQTNFIKNYEIPKVNKLHKILS